MRESTQTFVKTARAPVGAREMRLVNPQKHLAWLTLAFVALGAGALVFLAHMFLPFLRLEPELAWVSIGIAGAGAVASILGLRKPTEDGGCRVSRASVIGGIGNAGVVVSALFFSLRVAPLPETDFTFQVGDELPEFETPLKDVEGNDVRLGDQLGTTVLVFYRGGWCPFCTAHLMGLNDGFDEISELANLLAISPDLPGAAARYARSLDLPFAVLSDEGAHVARQYGLSHADPYKGEVPRPSTIILDGTGRIRWFHVADDVRDRASSEEIIGRLREIEAGL